MGILDVEACMLDTLLLWEHHGRCEEGGGNETKRLGDLVSCPKFMGGQVPSVTRADLLGQVDVHSLPISG